MTAFLVTHLSWILALHVMAFISWMAGLFYLPRLFVYHTQVRPGTEEYARLTLMEWRLLHQIMLPAMIVTFLTGACMAALPGVVDWHAAWWWTKLIALVFLFGFQGMCGRWQRAFARDDNTHSERFYRIANEVPTLLMMVIVIMIVVRP
ncbi:protoporphyrinogen oxidase HemJ [Oecophyllibacter saccharovorans]|uniref:Protoporphyrinogen IX oxidase n=1 Tax=Oecophyllibacter saccharovorans TaxID=2558360 RepID=A0A506UKX6_9PROT|nr:protoporphyrinogen oxidase HemJ [Oecophyllibacter saccharovorans]QDH15140.1 protoporphyrinogen oxidase HemJ [Oecophyllibacter saccharovorans]TPW33701.1 protoporphyrinogen oxidase HemJ [Oecophyllibacter saccharovorans]TPW33978.1 protoporphyrinogen oxidase HemJ [Oecophyllibacter saccharovorans]